MEQATNLFNKGLQMDTHPMVLGNDSLTDCLNGTLITMNGNEVVLQNDMGNRKIDHAYLPDGYEPVGIKEYGGIIYIACYNPITNKGLIGSFPSPERRKGTEYPELKTSINLNGFIGLKDNHFEIKKNTLLFPLTEEITLHTGDLFKLSFVDSVLDIIHYIVKQEVRNPLFTLKVGILNSLNEFVDITEDLKLYNIGSDEHPINYFISFPELNQLELSYTTIGDEAFIKNRLADLSVNIYSYKIVSPLYLQATINTFTRTDVSCYAEVTNKNNNNYNCDFELTVNYEHDCPFNDLYKPIIIVNGNPVRNRDINIKKLGEEEEYISKFGDLKSKVVYTFSVNDLPQETNLKVEFPLIHDNFYEDSIIVDTQEFNLDLEKVGSDTIQFNGYKYYNYDNYTNLRLDLTTYPKRKNSKLKNLYIELYDWLGDYPIMGRGLLYEGDIPSGVTEFTFEWPEEWKRRYLRIEIDYGTDIKPLISEKLMFITTELFNDNYNGTEEFDVGENNKYIENGDYKYNYLVHRYAKIDDYRKIKEIILTPTVEIISKSNDISSSYDSSYELNLSKGNITENTLNNWQLHFWPTIYNKELFPENIYVSHCSNNENYFDDEKEECEVYVNDILFALKKGNSNFIVTLEGLNILDELKNGSNSEKDVINFEFIRDAESLGEFLFTLKEIVNNFWESSVSDREICVQNTITSFHKFLEESSACYIEMPVICIDCRGDDEDAHFWIMNTFNRNANPGSDSNSHVLLKFENYKGNQSLINSYILGITNNMFVGEWNNNDHITPKENASIIIKKDNSQRTLEGYKRVWMKYEQNKYLPIYIGTLESGEESERNDFSQCYEYIKAGLRIPHLYVYNPTPQYFQSEIADFNESSYNLEFKYNVKLVLKEIFDETQESCKGYSNSTFKLENDYSGLFILNDELQPVTITLNQSNIKSSNDFVDLRESLKSGLINCAYVRSSGNKIEIIDDKGNLLDPKYVYKQIENQDTGSKITKSYIPLHKFSIDNYQIPYLLARNDKYEEGTFIQFEPPYVTYIEGKTKLTFDIPDIYNIPPYNNENNGE